MSQSNSGKRFSTDYSRDDVALVYPELHGECLTRAIQHQAFPAPDYLDANDALFWHEATVLSYARGRATVEADKALVNRIREAGGAE